jgi:hypothetical protein
MDIRQESGNKLRDPPISISKLVTLVMEGIKQGWSQEASLLLISLLIKVILYLHIILILTN